MDFTKSSRAQVGDLVTADIQTEGLIAEGLHPTGTVIAELYRPADDVSEFRPGDLLDYRDHLLRRTMDLSAAELDARLRDLDAELDAYLEQRVVVCNLITQVGDQYYGERASGIGGAPSQVSGMRLGTGSTAAAKTSTGASIVTYVSGSAVAIDGGFPTSALSSSSRRIQWKTTWSAGTATANSIAEAVITNESSLTDVIGSAANTISRSVLSPVINKGASDTLAITWNHDLLGA